MSDVCETSENENNVLCAVCMKSAQGLHYHVPTCHGCKSFFRRAIIRETVYPKCSASEECYMNLTHFTPKLKCRACRLQKCLDVGMIAQFGTLRNNHEFEIHIITRNQVNDPVWIMESFIKSLSRLEKTMNKIRHSKFDILVYPSVENLIDFPSQLAHAAKFEPMSGWPLSQEEFFQKQGQLIKHKIMFESEENVNPTHNINTKEWRAFDMIMAIEYTKTFTFFSKLSLSDRLCLVRGTAFMVQSATCAYFTYQSKKDILIFPDGLLVTEFLFTFWKTIHTDLELNKATRTELHRKLVMATIEPMIREKFDFSEYLLLKAIIVTNPAVGLSLDGQQIVRDERNKYGRALLDHCLLTHGHVDGPSRFTKIINYITVLEKHQKDFREYMTLCQLSTPVVLSGSRARLEKEIFCITLQ